MRVQLIYERIRFNYFLVSTNMAQKTALAQPKFIKVKDIESARSGYNVYVKIVSAQKRQIQTRDGKLIPMVDAVVADETGSAKAFFKGQYANIIEKDNVIAIRNGVKRFIKNFISLQIDLFGRVTLQKNINIAPSTAYNISEVQHKLDDRPRRNRQQQNRQGGNRRDYNRGDRNNQDRDNRPRRNDREDRREDRGQGRREDKGQGRREDKGQGRREDKGQGRRENRGEDRRGGDREGNVRSYRREEGAQRQDRKPDNREGGERRNNQSFSDKRQPRRQNYRRDPDRDFDRNRENRGGERQNRNDRGGYRNDRENRNERGGDKNYNRNDRAPRQYEQKREQNREKRAPLTWHKIADISPGEDRLNINAKVISAQKVGTRVRCVIGDETGISNAFLFESEFLHEGQYIVLFNARSQVVKEHIEIQLDRRGRVEKSRRDVPRVNEDFNLSQKAWIPME